MRGPALPATLLLLVALGLIATLLGEGSPSPPADDARPTLDLALSKVRRALWIYRADGSYPWDRILAAHARLPLEPDDRIPGGVAPGESDNAPLPGHPGHFLGVSSPCGSGSFYAVVRDNDDLDGDLTHDSDGRLLVILTATASSGRRERIEALLEYEPGTASLSVRSLRPLR